MSGKLCFFSLEPRYSITQSSPLLLFHYYNLPFFHQMSYIRVNMTQFKVKSQFKPTGDQPEAIQSLVDGLKRGEKFQTLLGITGSGKT
ncbi:MAG TPA: hypothetical protein DEH00_00920, partial [Candidatus Marinimicrobia bacterium]|nr:hypothetical protein [Candidatus Neomarinimicrobiota bacterium]